MRHELGFESSVLQSILEGKKIVEGRLAKDKFLNFTVGDKILLREDIWEDGEIIDSLKTDKTVGILTIKRYRSFEEMLESEGVENVIPSAQSIEEARSAYRQFYSIENEEKFGVIAFKIALQ